MNQNQPAIKKTSAYIPGIDGLRAVAVLAVMLFHLNPSFLPGGFAGVDVFFVISGYVVSASLARYASLGIVHFTVGFYARRIIRIFPALIVCLVVTTLLTSLFVPESWLSSTNQRTGLYAFFGISNYALIWFNDGYFSPRTDFNSFTHTWSLAVEEQFYVIFPLVFFVWMRFKGRKDFLGIVANWLLVSLLVVSLVYSWYETPRSPEEAFYLLPSRFWELACGALLFRWHTHGKAGPYVETAAGLFLPLGALLIGLGFIFSDESSFPFPWALLAVIGTTLLISGVVRIPETKPVIQKILESPGLVYIGKISYSLYLWHWPVYVLLRWTTGLKTLLEIAVAIVLTVSLAVVSYHFIERPIRKYKVLAKRQDWQVVLLGMLAIFISFKLSQTVFSAHSAISLSVTQDKEVWYPHKWPGNVGSRENSTLAGRKLFVLGDSHAKAYSTMLQQLSDEYGMEILATSGGGCAVANLLDPAKTQSPRCRKMVDDELAKIKNQARPGDFLFLASLRMNRLGDQWAPFPEQQIADAQYGEKAIADRKVARREALELISRFEQLDLHILMDAPKPVFKSPAFRCSDWFNGSNPICESGLTIARQFLVDYRKPVMDSLAYLDQNFSQLTIWDPFPALCDTAICSAIDNDGKPLFFDGDHLSAHGNRVLYPSFRSLILKLAQ